MHRIRLLLRRRTRPFGRARFCLARLELFYLGRSLHICQLRRVRRLSRIIGAMIPKMSEGEKRGRGRPVAFDRYTALNEAMKLFWERGYEGTSFDDLIGAMSISASTFYNSFGSKERLYDEAVGQYLTETSTWFSRILNEPGDTRAVFERLLEATAEEFTRPDLPAGCMISLACTHVSPSLCSIREKMVSHRALSEVAMADRLRRGIAAGDVPP